MNNMDEMEFVKRIDACFPYTDEMQWRSLVKQGTQISDNAAFMVLHEICRAPEDVRREIRLQMLHEWEDHFDHPLKKLVVESGQAIIDGTYIPVEKAIKYLHQVAKFPGNYNALSIVCFSCDDTDGQVDEVYNQIIDVWENS